MVKVKDANAPKRPANAYMMWMNDNRDKVQKENPEAKMTEMSKIMGDMWKEVGEAAKKKYQDKATAAKAKYDKAMEKYKKTPEYAAHQALVQEAKLKDSKKPFRKDENAPKRPQSAYFIWMNEVGRPAYTAAHPGADLGAVGKALGEQWKGMSDADKQPFQDKAEKAKAKYQTALAKYQKTAAYKKYEEEKKAYKDEQSKKRKQLEGKDDPKPAKKAKAPKRSASAKSKSKSKSRSRSAPKQRRRASKSKSRSRSAKRRAAGSKKKKGASKQ